MAEFERMKSTHCWTFLPFNNASMDGFALRASDVVDASPEFPVTLQVIADIPADSEPQCPLQPEQAARIMTGVVLPPERMPLCR